MQEDDDAVGELVGLLEIVRGEQDRRVQLPDDPGNQVVEASSSPGAPTGRGFIEAPQLGAADQSDG